MTKKKKTTTKKADKLKACLEHVQQNLVLMYQERLPLEVKINVESLFKDIDNVLKDIE